MHYMGFGLGRSNADNAAVSVLEFVMRTDDRCVDLRIMQLNLFGQVSRWVLFVTP